MESVKIKIPKHVLQMLVDSSAITTDEFILIGVDEINYDYSKNELWIAAKKESDKTYRKLKEIEFNIRHH